MDTVYSFNAHINFDVYAHYAGCSDDVRPIIDAEAQVNRTENVNLIPENVPSPNSPVSLLSYCLSG